MIWLASYPRSGNTFMRNLFFDVFGMESSSWPREKNSTADKKYLISKTHLLPIDIDSLKDDDFVIYLIRDGRDSIISNAHYRKNFLEPESNFLTNIEENILAPEKSYFGGWSTNVAQWAQRADIIIRFEDLTNNPKRELEKIRAYIPLPEPDYTKIKSFEELKYGSPRYGNGGNGQNRVGFAKSFFHRGTSGQFKTEMPKNLQKLFWIYHGDVMQLFGYSKDGTLLQPKFDKQIHVRRKIPFSSQMAKTRLLLKNNVLLFKHNLMQMGRTKNNLSND